VAKIFTFKLVNFDNFAVVNDYSLVTLNNSISHLQLLEMVKFDLILEAKILILQLGNLD